jgi:regulator of sigma E protease
MVYSVRKGALIVRMCWESVYDLITGRYTFAAVSGPVGIGSAIGEAARAKDGTLLYITALISINLGVMNLLPIPALDGGRLLTVLVEMITRKRIPKKIEGLINGVGLILLLLLSFVIMIKDVVGLII